MTRCQQPAVELKICVLIGERGKHGVQKADGAHITGRALAHFIHHKRRTKAGILVNHHQRTAPAAPKTGIFILHFE